jgi:Tfp pilus assembly protein PilE
MLPDHLHENSQGFTLMKTLTILIIGILSAVAYTQVILYES